MKSVRSGRRGIGPFCCLLLFLATGTEAQTSTVLRPGAYGAKSWREPVAAAASLPTTGNLLGDARVAKDTGVAWVWTGAVWVSGTVGPQGPQGIQGPPGSQGASGSQGATGPQGPQGNAGAAGAAGATGATGATGPAGPTGTAGSTGAKGDKGDTGDAGATGPVGPQGPPGSGGSGGAPAGTGTELQFRDGAALGAVTGSTVSGSNVGITGTLNIGGSTASNCQLYNPGFGLLRVLNGDGSDYCIADLSRFRAIVSGSNDVGGYIDSSGVGLRLDATVSWSNALKADGGVKDTFEYRDSAGIVGFNDGVLLSQVRLRPSPVGTCALAGLLRAAADGTLCSCNGTAWTATPLTGSCI